MAKTLGATGTALGLSIFSTTSAGATPTCGNYLYYYAGQYTNQGWAGAEGDISVDTVTLSASANNEHELNYLAAATKDSGCYNGGNSGQCQIQVGYGIGNVSGYVASSLSAYMEEEDYFAYDVNWPTFSLTQDDYISDFYTGSNYDGLGLYDAYITPSGSSPVLVGQAWLPNYKGATDYAQSEEITFTGASVACPNVAAYEYFGTDGSGGVNANTRLDGYNPTSLTWQAISNVTDHTDYDQWNKSYIVLPTAFSVWKAS